MQFDNGASFYRIVVMPVCTALILLLLSPCCLAGDSDSKPQLHPRFLAHPNWQEGRSFPAVTDGAWMPTEPILYYESETSSKLVLQVTLAHLPSSDAVKMKVHFECRPFASKKEMPMSMSKQVVICDERYGLPIEIRASGGNWTADGRAFSVEISISLLPTKVVSESPLIDSQQVSFEFYGDGWRLVTGRATLKRWKWLQEMYKHGFVMNNATDLLLGLNFSEAGGFDSVPFLKGYTEAVISMSELLQAVVTFGVTLERNTNLCQGSIGLSFMSGTSPFSYNWSIFKSFRIDLDSGLIWYSRHGLNAGLLQFLEQSQQQTCPRDASFCSAQGVQRCERPRSCVQVVGCSLLYSAQIQHNAPYSKPLFMKWYNMEQVAAAPPGAGKRECFLPPKWEPKIRIYGGIQLRAVKCPIICSMADQQYGFFKNSKPMPRSNREEFTQIGGVLVHQSGAFLLFDSRQVTHEDSGQYMCSAERLTAKFEVEIVLMPRFSVPDTALVGGELPSRIHVMDGDGYSVNCTVFFSGKLDFHLKSEFQLARGWRPTSWYGMNQETFFLNLSEYDSRGTIEETRTGHSRTSALTVPKVPPLTEYFDFSHRHTCIAHMSPKDLTHLHMKEYTVQSTSDVLVVPRPSADDFVAKTSPCCRDACDGQLKCRLEFSLKPAVHLHLKSLGLQVRAQFVPNATATTAAANPQPGGQRDAWIRERQQLHLSNAALLTWQMDEGLRQLTADQRRLFASLVPVFTYRMPPDRDGRPPRFSVLRGRQRWDQLSGSVCHSDPLCLFATTQEGSLGRLLSVADQVGITQQYLDSLPTVEPAVLGGTSGTGIPDPLEHMPQKVKDLLNKIFKGPSNGAGGSATSSDALLCLLICAAATASFSFAC